MKHSVRIFTVAMILLLTGCASVPMAPLDLDTKAKEFSPPPNKASLYIYRNEIFGAAIPITVSVNGKTMGRTGPQTYFQLNIIPGKYTVESHAENVSSFSLSVEAGKNYFVWQEVKMGMFFAGSKLQQVDETTGRAGVMESQLIASPVSDNDMAPLDAPIATPSPSQAPANDSVSQKLRDLQNLRKDGIISEDEYQKKKQQLLEKF